MNSLPDTLPVSNILTSKAQVTEVIRLLRSGEIKQIKGLLASNEGMCCMGVAAKVCNPYRNIYNVKDSYPTSSFIFGKISRHTSTGYTSTDVALACENDSGSSFQEIADWMERNILPFAPDTCLIPSVWLTPAPEAVEL